MIYAKKNRGIATLEASLALLVVLPFFMGAISVIDYFSKIDALAKMVDKNIYDTAVKPLSFSTITGTPQISVNQGEIQNYLQNTLQGIAAKLNDAFPATPHLIETAYAQVNVNPTTGVSSGISPLPYSWEASDGSLALP